ncbi:hypothetical protein FHG87_008501 [Trinorchestia longiramus]|nr:hypothetical protein FHG87_008501 [Trinorchestia longiramus]
MRVLAILLVVAVVAVAVSAVPRSHEQEVASFKVRVRRSTDPSDEKQVQVRVKRQFSFLSSNNRDRTNEVSSENHSSDDDDMRTGTAVLIKAGVMSLIIKGIIAALIGGSQGDAMTTTT